MRSTEMKRVRYMIPALILVVVLSANMDFALSHKSFGDSDESFGDKRGALLAA